LHICSSRSPPCTLGSFHGLWLRKGTHYIQNEITLPLTSDSDGNAFDKVGRCCVRPHQRQGIAQQQQHKQHHLCDIQLGLGMSSALMQVKVMQPHLQQTLYLYLPSNFCHVPELVLLIFHNNHYFWPQISKFVGVNFFHTGAGGQTNYLTPGPRIPVCPPP